MRWNSKNRVFPKLGDKKERVKFAIFPVISGGEWIWLEKYIAIYEYQIFYYDYEQVVSSGLIYEKYRIVQCEGKRWKIIQRKPLPYREIKIK